MWSIFLGALTLDEMEWGLGLHLRALREIVPTDVRGLSIDVAAREGQVDIVDDPRRALLEILTHRLETPLPPSPLNDVSSTVVTIDRDELGRYLHGTAWQISGGPHVDAPADREAGVRVTARAPPLEPPPDFDADDAGATRTLNQAVFRDKVGRAQCEFSPSTCHSVTFSVLRRLHLLTRTRPAQCFPLVLPPTNFLRCGCTAACSIIYGEHEAVLP
jgi:hypothetical protein